MTPVIVRRPEQLRHFSKLIFCSTEEQQSYGFAMTLGPSKWWQNFVQKWSLTVQCWSASADLHSITIPTRHDGSIVRLCCLLSLLKHQTGTYLKHNTCFWSICSKSLCGLRTDFSERIKDKPIIYHTVSVQPFSKRESHEMQRMVRSASVFNKIRVWEFEEETAVVLQTGAVIII